MLRFAILMMLAAGPGAVVFAQDAASEVFVRRKGQWWIEAYHNVDVKADARR